VLLWLTVTLQISIAQFFDYHPRRYLIQPLIQLPWLTHIPAHLTRPEQSRDATDMGASMTGA
jgi:hypothetical protein